MTGYSSQEVSKGLSHDEMTPKTKISQQLPLREKTAAEEKNKGNEDLISFD
jgi:hypothetical protein